MVSVYLFGILFIGLFVSVPIGVSIAVGATVAVLASPGLEIDTVARVLVTSLDSFPLLAIPFFILAGEIMGRGGLSERLFRFANSIVGSLTGGFAVATIITCMFFAAISGSGPATVAAVGGVMIPELVRRGYDRSFATAIVASAGALGVVIPPSVPMIVYGVASGASVGDLFIHGIIPGAFIAVMLSLVAYGYARRAGYKGEGKFSYRNVCVSFWDAKWALSVPVIILGGIYGGFFTPTEAAAVAVFVGLIISRVAYNGLNFRELWETLTAAAGSTAVIMIIVAAASVLGRVMTLEQIPTQVTEAMLSITGSTVMFLLLVNLMLLVMGTFLDAVSALIIVTPILFPAAIAYGVDPVHFGIIMVVNLAIGFITPPLGVNLFVGSQVSGLKVETIARAVLPYLGAMLVSLAVITYLPRLLWL